MKFAERLKELRTENHLTMEEVGAYIGVGRANIYKYEHGIITNIPVDNVNALAELFDVSPAYIMGWSDERVHKDAIPIPNSETFMKAYNVMDYDDRRLLTEIFIRANQKLEQMESGKK
jgi:transcriptional regulator with XRE-family HTH domain